MLQAAMFLGLLLFHGRTESCVRWKCSLSFIYRLYHIKYVIIPWCISDIFHFWSVYQTMLHMASNMLLVGLGDRELLSHLADFSLLLLQLGRTNIKAQMYRLPYWISGWRCSTMYNNPSIEGYSWGQENVVLFCYWTGTYTLTQTNPAHLTIMY